MVLVNVKVTEEVKSELASLKEGTESYNTVISNLIKENAKLKADNERLFNLTEVLASKI